MPTFYEDSMRRRMLPQTLGLTSPDGVLTQDVKPPALPLSMAIRKQIADLEAQSDDTSAAQAYGRQQGESGQAAMLNALAAQFAGPQFESVQAQFLKRAQAAQQPMRVGKGMVTPDGQFIGDPGAKREAQITRLSREAEFADRSESQAELQADRIAAQRAAQEAELQRRRERDQDRAAYEKGILALRANQGGGQSAPMPTGPITPVAPTGVPKTAQIIQPGIDPTIALGATGKIANTYNTVFDALGFGDPKSLNKQATAQLNALSNQTRIALADAVPGRPSNYLLQLQESQIVSPNTLSLGPAGAQNRVETTLNVITTGLDELAGILNNPTGYTKTDIAKAQRGYQRLSQLKAEYDALGKAFTPSQGSNMTPEQRRARIQQLRSKQGPGGAGGTF